MTIKRKISPAQLRVAAVSFLFILRISVSIFLEYIFSPWREMSFMSLVEKLEEIAILSVSINDDLRELTDNVLMN